MIFGINTAHDISKLPQISLAYRLVKLHITNFEISLQIMLLPILMILLQEHSLNIHHSFLESGSKSSDTEDNIPQKKHATDTLDKVQCICFYCCYKFLPYFFMDIF